MEDFTFAQVCIQVFANWTNVPCSRFDIIQVTSSVPCANPGAPFLQFKRCRNGEQYGFFGVFDGHGGPAAASFVKDNLFVKLESDSNFPDDMPTALSAHSRPLKD